MAKNPVFNQATGPGIVAHLVPAFGNGLFITAQAGAPGPAVVIVSADYGKTWQTRPLPATGDWGHIVFGNGAFLLVESNNGPSNNTYRSTDGVTWTHGTLPASALWYCVAFVNDKFVAMQYGASSGCYSLDGTNWVPFNVPTGANYRDVGYGNGKYLMVSDTGNGQISNDGIVWADMLQPTDAYFTPAYGMGKWVMPFTNFLFYSADGVHWTQGPNLPSAGPFYQMLFDQINGVFFCVCNNASTDTIYSEDGINFKLATTAQRFIPSIGLWRGKLTQQEPQKYVYIAGNSVNDYVVGDIPILKGTRFTASNFTRLLKAN